MRPLYSELGIVALGETAHAGLVFDKFIDGWSNPPNTKPGEGAKQKCYEAIRDRLKAMASLVDQRLNKVQLRRSRLVLSRGGRLYTSKTAARLIIGLGSGHPFEAGLTWHPTLGVPYLPGSSIKGMIRAWADPREKQGNVGWGDPTVWSAIKHLFGDTDDSGAGSIIVFDALPTTCPKLEVDIMTPHYGLYYSASASNPPADWYNPTPIPFLTVAETQEFEFALAPRGPNGDLDTAKDLLEKALQHLGAGGKTAVGYGRFGPLSDVTEQARNGLEAETRRAEQEREAAAQQAALASLSGLDRELAEFIFEWKSTGSPEAAAQHCEAKATGWFQRLEGASEASEEDKKKIAQALKLFYGYLDKWNGTRLAPKQRAKVTTIKRLLGNVESRGL